ncbi:MAG: PEP-CTERM sorting domain-containing protein, partial [Gammaproteobacteria bacterium]
DPQTFEAGDGHLKIIDPSSGTTGLYDAPSKFSSAIAPGTVLELDFKVFGGSYDNAGTGLVPLFYVERAGTSAGALYSLPEAAIPIGTWLEFSIPIVPNGDALAGPGAWFGFTGGGLSLTPDDGTAFDFAFGGTNPVLRIFGELTKDAPDADGTQLDNVRLSAVPVPAALPMMLSALAAFGLWRRKA